LLASEVGYSDDKERRQSNEEINQEAADG